MRVDDDYLRSIDSLYDEDGLPVERPAEDYDLMMAAERALSSPLIVPQREPSAAEKAGLPLPVDLGKIWNNLPELAPELISGVLRQGHKMIVSGPSKAGKSFALMELAYAIAEGMSWLGNKCRQGKVLYINMEIDDASCYRRIEAIYRARKMNVNIHPSNITMWGLRGYSMPLSKLTPIIIDQAKRDYAAIIIDPLYKVMDGDENSNSDVGHMVGQFDRIARETGASVIYAHHFAKGTSGDKEAIDRAAGAGSFARDPDAIITLTELDTPDLGNGCSAWRVEFILREFPYMPPISVRWEYPVHNIDRDLDEEEVVTSYTKLKRRRQEEKEARIKDRIHHVHEAVSRIVSDGRFSISDFKEAYSSYEDLSSPNSYKSRLLEAGYVPESVENGKTTYWKKR